MGNDINIGKVAKKLRELNLSTSELAEVYTGAKITIRNNNLGELLRDCSHCPFHTILKNDATVACRSVVRSLFGTFEMSCNERLSLLVHVMDSRRTVINGRFTKI